MGSNSVLKLGTRGSPLARAQAREVRDGLCAAHGWGSDAVEILVIRTSGDAIQDRALADAGGKGLFTKELDQALMDGAIQLAVHSAKDLPTSLPDAVAIAGYLPREDVRDAWISPVAPSPRELPRGAVVGTASLRRQAQLLRLRPDLTVKLLRGNVETRLRKLVAGEFDATLLALAGLNRLGLAHRATAVLDTDHFLPAVGQGAIAIAVARRDGATAARVDPVLDHDTIVALACERAFLTVLDGSCRTPIAGYARMHGGDLEFRGLILKPDGSDAVETISTGGPDDAAELGAEAGHALLARSPSDVAAQFGHG